MEEAFLHCEGRAADRELPPLPQIRRDDRILILAPHEDDETLGTGGIIQKALSVGAAVRVVYLTYGDHNELAFMIYRKRPWLSPALNRKMGERRRQEAIDAMAHLGLSEEHLVFLGFPDNGTLAIWKKHWGEAPPLLSILTDTTHVPYPDAASYDKPYKGEEIAAAIQQQLLDFRPTRVFVSHPVDGNPDHRSFYLFLQLALLELGDRIQAPLILAYPIHMGPWPRPHWFHPEMHLLWPDRLASDSSTAWAFELPDGHVRKKYEAICLYRSQMTDADYWLTTFARRNEIFTSPGAAVLPGETPGFTPAPPLHGTAVPTGETEAYEGAGPAGHVGGVSYGGGAEGLTVRIDLRHAAEREMGVSVYAFGYRRDVPFAKMPKLHIESLLGRLRASDGERLIPPGPVTARAISKEITFVIPWSFMGDPGIVFAQARGLAGGTPVSITAWRMLIRGRRDDG